MDGVQTLVLLHAFPLDSRMWDAVRDRLSDHVRLITPDQRGAGDAPPSLDTVATDVLALLDDHGVEQAVLGGCSMGGYASMAVLRAAPHRVSGLVLIDTKAPADTDEARAGRLDVAARAEREGPGHWLADSLLPNLLARPDSGEVRRWIGEQDGASVAWAQRAMAARPDSRDTLRAVVVPTLVVHGAQDALMPVTLAEEMTELTRGQLVVLPNAGHLAPVEEPDAVASAIISWLPLTNPAS
ncbi:MAG: alpha/beta hydrolase [Actinomycetota bacterium]|nr:alpha/beta hydrolase [Actinomycetota bacterium]